jgi:PEGA domain-containing protein
MTPTRYAVDASSAPDTPQALASWYTEGASDGVGDRLLMFDNSGASSLELLRFRRKLAATPGFERALRERVAELASFAHTAFPQIRAVQRLDGGELALVSTSTPGKRLGEAFRAPPVSRGAHPEFAAWLVRDLTAALADLQRHADGIAHAALTPERIVITPDGRLVITEHVLGSALDALRLSMAELWRETGVIASGTALGTARLDWRADVIQLGWIVLSVLLGRRVAPADHSGEVETLLDEFGRRCGTRSPALVPSLRRWLERALQLDEQAFESAMDAQAALYQLRLHTGPHAMVTGGRPSVEQLIYGSPLPHLTGCPAPPQDVIELTIAPAEETPDALSPSPPLADDSEMPTMRVATEFIDQLRVETAAATIARAEPRRFAATVRVAWTAAAICAAIAVAEGVVISRLMAARAPIALPGVPVTVESTQAGDAIIVDGREVGVTPLAMTLTSGMRSIRVRTPSTLATGEPAPVQPAAIVDHPVDGAVAAALAQTRSQRGGIRLSTPIELHVLEGERVLGSSADGPIVTTAGRHELDFINAAVGYRSRQVVDIKAGQIVKMTVAPPNGRVSINAVPWAQVTIDGNTAGETPLANLPLAIGEHQITFRHPQLGEQTQKVIVKADGLTRVSATFAR